MRLPKCEICEHEKTSVCEECTLWDVKFERNEEKEEKEERRMNIEIFKPMVYEDICETPILITSKSQLREECKKHGVQACRLM